MAVPIERISTVIVPAVSYQLVDLPTLKAELSINATDSTNDTVLTREIAYISQLIINNCSSPFAPFALEQRQDLIQFGRDPFPGKRFGGEDEIALARCPLISVASVVQSLPDGFTKTLAAGTDFLADLATGRLLRLRSDGRIQRWEAFPLTVQYIGGYGALVSGESASVPASGPFTVRPANAMTFAFDQGVAYASGAALTKVGANPSAGQYAVSFSISAGATYTFAAADEGAAVELSYGYNVIPPDLISHGLQIITGRFAARGRDPALIQQDTPGVGTQRWWFGGTPGQTGALPPDIDAALDTYRQPRLA